MKSGTFFVLFFILPVATEAGFWDIFDMFNKDDDLLSFNSKDLENDLRKSLFGQHIAVDTVLKAVSWFMRETDPPKALVLSIHGQTGVGKNYITKIIARNIYKLGLKSNHVHTFISGYHFPHEEMAEMYELQLRQWIHGNVSNFPRSMFIFDEMHPRLIDTIKPFLDYTDNIDGVSFNKAIFIFLSHTGEHIIGNVTLDFWRRGCNREEIQIQSEGMETQIFEYLFNDKNNGFWHSSLINQHLIDHYIPFLPLELKHVHQCVMAEMGHLNMTQDYDLAYKVAKDMPFFPEEEKVFAVKGCKTVRQKMVLYLKLQ
ncbi:torsin-1A-like [Carassius auratus]|uniref:Torsin-1A-like n=1 Tax=Carassius auratus TaxID=7957 RepID=A0A6P6J525_CARAU|nr:torsin-1A-like [Carassius auratus]